MSGIWPNDGIADLCATPFYLFDEGVLEQRVAYLRRAFPADAKICYAMKANSFILKAASRSADLIEVCSPGELRVCRFLGIPDEMLVISGVNKEPEQMRELIAGRAHVHRYTVESRAQFDLIESIAREEGVCVPILIRITSGSQFGMEAAEALSIIADLASYPSVDFRGLQFFSGTQKSSPNRIRRELRTMDDLIERITAELSVEVAELEYGAGLPVDYCEEDPAAAEAAEEEFLTVLRESLDNMRFAGVKIVELGRSIAASCGIYVTRVVDAKTNGGHNYAIVDGGKHQVAYYGQALALKPPVCRQLPEKPGGAVEEWAICGSLCTTNDILIKKIELSDLAIGDCLVFANAGAYCMTEGISLFLSRDLPSIYLADPTGEIELVRPRFETSCLNTPNGLS